MGDVLACREADLERIRRALAASAEVISALTSGHIAVERKENQDPVTEVDLRVDEALRAILPQAGEGWLSEESADDLGRLDCSRVWVVDPLDGTREFVEGLPEWCVSIGLVEDGEAVAGGICNPASGETVIGSRETGVLYNGAPARVRERTSLDGLEVLASRSELRKGSWERLRQASIVIRPLGSVAYKLALVAAGRTDATWSLAPKHEWDVAAGVALVQAGGGQALTLEGKPIRFNQPRPWLPGLVASHPALLAATLLLIGGPPRE